MFSLAKIILPVDFSERSAGAARYVEALATAFGSEVFLVHVLPPPHYEFSALEVGGPVLNELFASRGTQVKKELDEYLRGELSRLEVRRVLLEGDPATELVKFASEQKAGLIVMPTHGYGPFRRFILGSVTAKVLHDADCPVWTGVHLEQAPAVGAIQFRNILAAIDLGPQSKRTLTWAGEIAKRFDASLRVLHVMPCTVAGNDEEAIAAWKSEAVAKATEAVHEVAAEAGIEAKIKIETGDAPKTVCDHAQRIGADLLVIGRGSAAGVFGRLRTNAYGIIRESPCAVVSV